MKKSVAVPATLVVAVAATMLSGCSESSVNRDCVDDQGRVLSDDKCDDKYRGHRNGIAAHPYGGHWVYGGNLGSNGRVSGGSQFAPSEGAITTRSGSVVRGGFGSVGSGRGGFSIGG